MKKKQVCIDYDLFIKIVRYVAADASAPFSVAVTGDDFDRLVRARDIWAALQDKLNRLGDHETFTNYKTAAIGSDEREALRQQYLDRRMVLGSFRSDCETSDTPDLDERYYNRLYRSYLLSSGTFDPPSDWD